MVVLRAALDGGDVAVATERYQAHATLPPAGDVPVYIAALSPAAYRRPAPWRTGR
ncbi:MAG: hypothetical protein U0531_00290 [Dehalococcoidia bacterium]